MSVVLGFFFVLFCFLGVYLGFSVFLCLFVGLLFINFNMCFTKSVFFKQNPEVTIDMFSRQLLVINRIEVLVDVLMNIRGYFQSKEKPFEKTDETPPFA